MTQDTNDAALSDLFAGLRGQARRERAELVQWLLDRGFSIEQIRTSLSPMLLPANRIIGDDGTFVSSHEVADSAGLPLELIQRLHRAIGLARVDDAEQTLHSRADAESVLPAAALVGLGFDPEDVARIVRLLVDGLTRVAVTMRQAALQALLRPGATELQLALALEALALETEPLVDPMISELARLTLRHSFQTEAVNAAERAAGRLPGAREIAVAFADLVGFTRLGEALPPEELVQVPAHLANLTRGVVAEPVQFVKTVGDAVMLVSPDAGRLITVVLDLIESAAAQHLPRLRVGVAVGLAVNRAGDWYGSPVNLASRITSAAPPGRVLVAESARTASGNVAGVRWSFAKTTHLRGVSGGVRLFRATRTT